MRSFDVFFELRLNKQMNKQSRGWWFETPSCPSLWRHCNDGHSYASSHLLVPYRQRRQFLSASSPVPLGEQPLTWSPNSGLYARCLCQLESIRRRSIQPHKAWWSRELGSKCIENPSWAPVRSSHEWVCSPEIASDEFIENIGKHSQIVGNQGPRLEITTKWGRNVEVSQITKKLGSTSIRHGSDTFAFDVSPISIRGLCHLGILLHVVHYNAAVQLIYDMPMKRYSLGNWYVFQWSIFITLHEEIVITISSPISCRWWLW